MYKLLLPILVFVLSLSFACEGQSDTTKQKVRYWYDTTYTWVTIDTIPLHNDTTRVVMLVCDTAHFFESKFISKPCKDSSNIWVICGDEIKIDMGNNGIGLVLWITGYAVRKDWETPYYLDDNKQRLPKTIVVWQSK